LSAPAESDQDVADRLRALRQKMGVSQQEFCRQSGASLSTLQRWERGDKVTPAAKWLIELMELRWTKR
jgi:DNA-binding transcriptional regulator YiaG